MKQLLLALMVFGLGIINVNAQSTKAAFKFDNTTHDFGTIPEGPQVTHFFEFSNTGKEPLVIQNVTASCGCTTPDWPKQPILPGKKGKIKVVYNTSGRVGPFNKEIFIQSNAENIAGQERFELVIKGTVKAEEKKS